MRGKSRPVRAVDLVLPETSLPKGFGCRIRRPGSVAGLREFALSEMRAVTEHDRAVSRRGHSQMSFGRGQLGKRFIWSAALALKNLNAAICANVRVADSDLILLGVCLVLV